MASGLVHGAKLISNGVLTCLEYLNKEIPYSERFLKWNGVGQFL